MQNWDEVRTAYQVARIGTVSGAAEVLSVHHATVIRHIDALEARLGVKLFQRHARGYTPTEAGNDLLRVAQTTFEQFAQLEGRIKGQGNEVSGELVVTSLSTLNYLLVPVLADFQRAHPEICVRYLTGMRLFRLEYGEAHVAIRAGAVPDQPDNVVQDFYRQKVALYAAKSYVEERGMPKGPQDYALHRWVGPDDEESRAPFNKWLRENVAREAVSFRSEDHYALRQSVREGAGIGFLPVMEGDPDPSLVQVEPSREEWSSPLWLVTHMDLHRTNKVQTFLSFLKDRSKAWV